MRGLPIMAASRLSGCLRRDPQCAATRSGGPVVRRPAQFIEPLARAAIATGIAGLFIEVHDHPERALSDGANALRLDLLAGLLTRLRSIDELVKGF